MLLLTVILMDLLTGMEFDLFVPSFPALQNQFALSPFLIEALLSSNFIGYCISLFIVGSLADHYGRKPVIVLGLMIFIVGSILCLSALNYPMLLIGRLFQGIGIAAPSILSFLIIADAYSLKEQQFLMAMLNAIMNIAAAIAPVAGSYITLYFDWQGNFSWLLSLGVFTLVMTFFFIPKYKLPKHKEAFSLGHYFPLFQSKTLLLLLINLICTFVPYWIFVGISPLLYMQDLHVSLSHFGYYQGVFAFIFALGCLFFGWIIHRYSQKSLLVFSNKITLFSLICLVSAIFYYDNPLFITIAFIPFIISQVIPSNILFPLCLNFVPAAKAKVSAILQGSRLIFSALSLQLVSLFYQGNFKNIGIVIGIFVLIMFISQKRIIKNLHLIIGEK